MAVAALSEKVITPSTIVSASGVFYFGRRPYHDHLKGGHGNITVYDAFRKDLRTCSSIKWGSRLGVDKMYDYIHLLGIGQKTGIELSREVSGTMRTFAWKKATVGEEWATRRKLKHGDRTRLRQRHSLLMVRGLQCHRYGRKSC